MGGRGRVASNVAACAGPFACAYRAELEQRAQRLDELGIKHGGIVDAGYGSGVSFRDPDNIALEFFAPPS